MSTHGVLHSSFSVSWGFCLLAIALHPAKISAVGFHPVSPEELKMTSEPAAPGAPAIILYRDQFRDDDIQHGGHEENYYRIKILTEEGRKYADIEIPYERFPSPYGEYGQEARGIHARTIRPDGSIVNFEGKPFTKPVLKSKGIKYLTKTFTLPGVQVGSIIEYYYSIGLPEGYYSNSHWIISDALFTKAAKFSLIPIRELNLRWVYQNIPPAALQAHGGNEQSLRLEVSDAVKKLGVEGGEPDKIYSLSVTNVPALLVEDLMPPPEELKERVDFIYSVVRPEEDPNKFWSKVAKRLDGEAEKFMGRRKAMENAVAEMVGPNDRPEEKLQKIYARVQQMRNTSYEVYKTEEERKRAKEEEPTSAEQAWKRGYANDEHLTELYLALVQAAGFDAYGVVVADRGKYFFNPTKMDESPLNRYLVLSCTDKRYMV